MRIWFFALLGLIFFAGCTTAVEQQHNSLDVVSNNTTTHIEKIQENSRNVNKLENTPVVKFTDSELNTLGVSCSGSPEEIANCIYDWQKNNMIYVPTTDIQFDFKPAYPLRWNEWFPGIFTARDLIKTRLYDGRPYGVCWDFATIYCSIAEHYGLKCRIVQTKSKISEGNSDLVAGTGLNENEFAELESYLRRRGKNYTYEAVRRISTEGAGHYWAEVYLPQSTSEFKHGDWVVMDASNLLYKGRSETMKKILVGDWQVVNWTEKDKSKEAQEFQARIDSGEDLAHENSGNNTSFDEFTEGRKHYSSDLEQGTVEEYAGVTDELGNTHRAKTIDDFMQGKALAPYISTCEDMCDFLKAGNQCLSDCKEDQELVKCYDDCAGTHFFLICDYICADASDSEWPSCYEACSGEPLNTKCDNSCD